MDARKYIVLVIDFDEKHEQNVENYLKSIEELINEENGKIRRIYQGSEHRVISALESIMKLTEYIKQR